MTGLTVPSKLPGFLQLVPIVISAGFIMMSAWVYKSDYLRVQALQGNKTVEQYRALIADASVANHDARARNADVIFQDGNTTSAISQLMTSRVGKHHWQGWDRMGQFYESLAFSPAGTTDEVRLACRYYDAALSVNPSRPGIIKRRAVLALKEGDWHKASAMAIALDGGAAGSSDANYIRAQIALAVGDTDRAAGFYERIMTSADRSSGSLYRLSQVENALSNRPMK